MKACLHETLLKLGIFVMPGFFYPQLVIYHPASSLGSFCLFVNQDFEENDKVK